MNNGVSLAIASIAGLVAISLFYYIFRAHLPKKILFYAIFFYMLRLSIGVFHYLYFFDGEYLNSTNSDFYYLAEYIWMFESMDVFSQGLSGDMEADLVQGYADSNKNYEMLLAMSLIFLIGGKKILSVATLNSLVTILAAYILYFISYRVNKNIKNASFCFFIVCLQPFEIITSILARDTAGQFLILYAVFLVVFYYRLGIFKIFITILASWLSSLHREVYFFIPLISGFASSFIYDLIYNFNRFKKSNLVILLFIAFFGILTINYLIEVFLGRFLDINFLSKIVGLPISFFYALVGPFPWSQIFMDVPGVEFHLPQYLTSSFNICFYISLILFLSNKSPNEMQLVIIIFFLLYFLSGTLVYGGKHTVYYSIAIPLLAILDIHSNKFLLLQRFFMITMGFIILTLMYDNLL